MGRAHPDHEKTRAPTAIRPAAFAHVHEGPALQGERLGLHAATRSACRNGKPRARANTRTKE
jgi:hypothetical protein